MILVFGGTTEGRRAIKVLEEAGSPYFYSTKTGEQDVTLRNGRRTDGAMDGDRMAAFCRERGIRLIVDAAHPFASLLHQTIGEVSQRMGIPVVRFERIYPPRDPDITWIDDYSEVPTDITSLLATTGVQSISKLKWLERRGVEVFYRILNRPSSVALAEKQQTLPMPLPVMEGSEMGNFFNADDYVWVSSKSDYSPPFMGGDGGGSVALLLKESGLSGGFVEKTEEARRLGMRIIALKRPAWANVKCKMVNVNGPYGLRRAVERLLPEFFPLHSGLTTGTCATAVAVAATLLFLQHRETHFPTSSLPNEVPVRLPNGETIMVPVGYGEDYAYCIKESGDDPDVTNGIEVRAQANIIHEVEDRRNKLLICRSNCPPPSQGGAGGESIEVYAGEGIGHFTLPGFDYPPGEAAINRVPRKMLMENLRPFLDSMSLPDREGIGVGLVLSVPNGEEIARRTFNPRLGIEGGISIIGVSGIVMPYSEEAFIRSIRKCMEVARAAFQDVKWKMENGKSHVVIGSGMKSEQQLRDRYPDLPHQAFVEYGNYIGETLKMADELGFQYVTLGIMIGKAVKLAQGHLDTHSRRVVMDKAFVAQLLREAHCPLSIINYQLPKIAVARELWNLLSPDEAERFSEVIVRHCYEHCKPLLPKGELTILLLRSE